MCPLAITLLLLCGCSSQNLSIKKPDDPAIPVGRPPGTVSYDDFWDAIDSFGFEFAENRPLSPTERRYADSLSLLAGAELSRAEDILAGLCAQPEDERARERAASLYAQLLVYGSRWDKLFDFMSESSDPEKREMLLLAEAMRKAPQEAYSFPASGEARPKTRFSAGGQPLIEVVVNGRSRYFILDTGAGMSALSSDTAKECGVTPIGEGSLEAGTATSAMVEARPAIVADLDIGGLRIANHPVVVIDAKELTLTLLGFITVVKIDGIIGWNAIQNMHIEIDFGKGTTRIRPPVNWEGRRRNFFWCGYPIVRAQDTDGRTLYFGLDTGGRKTRVGKGIIRKLGFENLKTRSSTIGGAGGWQTVESEIVPELNLVLDGRVFQFTDIETTPTKIGRLSMDGILGDDIAGKGRMEIDFPNGIFGLSFD